MTNAEHLIENAIIIIQCENDPAEAWSKFVCDNENIEMSNAIGIQLMYVWQMAQYVNAVYIERKDK